MSKLSGVMPCDEVLESLEAFVDGELDALEQEAIESHIASCEACAAEHRLTEAVRSGLRALPELDAPSAMLSRVLREAGADRFQRTDTQPARPAWVGWAVAASAAAALGTALLMRPTPTPSPEVALSEPATDPADVAQATEEARYALAYLVQVSRRTGLELRNDLLIERVAEPTVRGLSRSLLFRLPSAPPAAEENDLAAIDSDRS